MALLLSKWVGLGEFHYRAVRESKDLYTIRRTKRGSGVYQDSLYWEWCQCGRWIERGGLVAGRLPSTKSALRTFASGSTADHKAERLKRGRPTSLELLGWVIGLILLLASVDETMSTVRPVLEYIGRAL